MTVMNSEVQTGLLRRLRRHGAFDVNACFNCGNCTAVCPLAEADAAFPRRLIRAAQLGLEDRLLSDEHLWLCYACGECSQTCPREADPAQFMAAARRYATARYDFTGLGRVFAGSALAQTVGFLVLSAIFTLLLLWHKGGPTGRPLALFEFIPGHWIHDLGVALFVVVGISLLAGVGSMVWRFLQARRARNAPPLRWSAFIPAVGAATADALAHRTYRNGDADKAEPRLPLARRPWFAHACILGGFLAMLAATTLDYLLKPIGSPVPPWYPIRLLGTVGGLVCLYGLAVTIIRRLRGGPAPYDHSRFADWFFLGLLTTTVITGLATELVVYLPGSSAFGHGIFVTHVVLAMDLIVLLPLSKFAHAVYRPLALALSRWKQASAEAEVSDAAPATPS